MSGSSPNLNIKLTATDVSVGKTLDKVGKQLDGTGGAADKLGKSLAKASDPNGIAKLSEGMTALGRSSLDVFRSMDRVVPQFAALTGAASIAGMGALVARFSELGNAAALTGQRLGLPTDRLTALRGAARLAGASAEDLDGGLGSLDEKLRGAAFGRDAGAAALFGQLHVNFKNADGSARGAADALGEVADGIKNLKERGAQTRAAQLLGLESLLPLLVKGREGIQSLSAESARLGAVITPEMAERAKALHTSFAGLSEAVEGVENRLGDKWGQAIKPYVDGTANWIANNKTLADSYAEIGAAIMSLGLIRPAAWVAKLLGISLGPAAAIVGATLAAGEEAGRMNMPFIDENGRSTGATWGGEGRDVDNGSAWDPVKKMYRRIAPSWAGGDPASVPRGIRNNNPLNLGYVPGQGAIGSDGRFGIYKTMADGVAAEERQLLRYQDQGDDTVSKIINRWAPSSDGNDTKAYVDAVTRDTGFGANDKLNLRDPDQAQRLIWSMSKHENGRAADGRAIQSGVDQALNGSVTVDVNLRNAPPGTTATASASGSARAMPPRVETAMPGVH